MFLHRNINVSKQLTDVDSGSAATQYKTLVILGSGEMPKSVEEFKDKSIDQLFMMGDCGSFFADVRRDQSDKDVLRLMRSSLLMYPNGRPAIKSSIYPKAIIRSGTTYNESPPVEFFAGSHDGYGMCGFQSTALGAYIGTSYVRYRNDFGSNLDEINNGEYQNHYNYFEYYLEHYEPIVPSSLQVYGSLAYGVGSYSSTYRAAFYISVSIENAHDVRQPEDGGSLDWWNSVATNQKVMVTNVDLIPSEVLTKLNVSTKGHLRNFSCLQRRASDWLCLSIRQSYNWLQVSANTFYDTQSNTIGLRHDSIPENQYENGIYGRFISIRKAGGNSKACDRINQIRTYGAVDGYSNESREFGVKHLVDNKADSDIITATWALIVPLMPLGSTTTRKTDCPVYPMILLDVGGPNDGKAMSLEKVDLTRLDVPEILNCKIKFGWSETNPITNPTK